MIGSVALKPKRALLLSTRILVGPGVIEATKANSMKATAWTAWGTTPIDPLMASIFTSPRITCLEDLSSACGRPPVSGHRRARTSGPGGSSAKPGRSPHRPVVHPWPASAPRAGQAQLHQISMGRQAKRALERTGQAEAVDAAGQRQGIHAYIVMQVGMQVFPGFVGDQRQAWVVTVAAAPVELAGEAFEQLVHGPLSHDAQLAAVQGAKGLAGGEGQARVVGQGRGKTQLAVDGSLFEDRAHFPRQPLRVEVEHVVGKTVGRGRVAVMQLAGFHQEHLAGHAVVARAAAVELLHALFGHADQVAVVPMGIVGMAFPKCARRVSMPVSASWDRSIQLCAVITTPRRNRRCYLAPIESWASRRFVRRQLNSPAAILIEKPRIAVLNRNPISDCPSTTLRMLRVATPTSDVCTATPMVKEKYRKSQ